MTGLSGVTLCIYVQFQVSGLLVVGQCARYNKLVGEFDLITLLYGDVVQKDINVVGVDVDSQRHLDWLNAFVPYKDSIICPRANCVFHHNTVCANTQNFIAVIVVREHKGKGS